MLLDRLRGALAMRRYSLRTQDAYVGWVRRFILFHGKRHPLVMGADEVNAFLTSLAVDARAGPPFRAGDAGAARSSPHRASASSPETPIARPTPSAPTQLPLQRSRVAAATQNQALCAILFLYRVVLENPLPWLDELVRAQRPVRLPVVLTRDEVASVLGRMGGTTGLVARLLYGSGLRLLEALRLRVKDVDFGRSQILVRDPKGRRDRATMLPVSLRAPLREHLRGVQVAAREGSGGGLRCGGVAGDGGVPIDSLNLRVRCSGLRPARTHTSLPV